MNNQKALEWCAENGATVTFRLSTEHRGSEVRVGARGSKVCRVAFAEAVEALAAETTAAEASIDRQGRLAIAEG